MAGVVQADYLVVGAGASGMAFTDALIDHSNARVALIDRRHGVGGHWLDAYPFVRLHQASAFYGVASTRLGRGQLQHRGPEAGLHERADAAEICSYYCHILSDRMLESDRVQFLPNCDYLPQAQIRSRVSGQLLEVPPACRVVDARYLSPDIPAKVPAPFEMAAGTRVIPVGDLANMDLAPSQYVIAGSGKTASDACIWLLSHGVDAARICWIRPRDPWLLNRAVVQPDPAVFLGMAAEIMESAASSASLEELFLRLENVGIMVRIDRSVTPTMAKTPTLSIWELEQLRSIEHVVRLGHVRRVEPGRITLEQGSTGIAKDAVVVHCAASGLKYPPVIPIWGRTAITLQPVRAGFPCFGAALAGYVEATRDDDAEKNRLCPATPYPNSLADWALMNLLGTRASMAFGSESDIKAWADGVAINPAGLPPKADRSPELRDVLARLKVQVPRGLEGLARLTRAVASATRQRPTSGGGPQPGA